MFSFNLLEMQMLLVQEVCVPLDYIRRCLEVDQLIGWGKDANLKEK